MHQIGQQPLAGRLQRAQPLHQPVDRLVEIVDLADTLVGERCLGLTSRHIVQRNRGAAQRVVKAQRKPETDAYTRG